jgi:hypothetical protein
MPNLLMEEEIKRWTETVGSRVATLLRQDDRKRPGADIRSDLMDFRSAAIAVG